MKLPQSQKYSTQIIQMNKNKYGTQQTAHLATVTKQWKWNNNNNNNSD